VAGWKTPMEDLSANYTLAVWQASLSVVGAKRLELVAKSIQLIIKN